MRDIHTRMLGAVLEDEGLRGLAELAAEEAGGPVAILLPARGLAAASAEGVDVEALATVAGKRLRKPGTDLGDEVIAEHPVEAGGETIGQLPSPIKVRAARIAAGPRVFNLTISNVAGPRMPLYVAGARATSIYPGIAQ